VIGMIHPQRLVSSTVRSVVWRRVVKYSLKDVSPRLAAMRDTSIPMPGVGGSPDSSAAAGSATGPGSEAVTIARFNHEVTVLPTKTRPKKLSILGSDGETYTYLLKVGPILVCSCLIYAMRASEKKACAHMGSRSNVWIL